MIFPESFNPSSSHDGKSSNFFNPPKNLETENQPILDVISPQKGKIKHEDLKNLIISNEMAIANLATKVDVINEKCHTWPSLSPQNNACS